jgi:hypothetical protein
MAGTDVRGFSGDYDKLARLAAEATGDDRIDAAWFRAFVQPGTSVWVVGDEPRAALGFQNRDDDSVLVSFILTTPESFAAGDDIVLMETLVSRLKTLRRERVVARVPEVHLEAQLTYQRRYKFRCVEILRGVSPDDETRYLFERRQG